MRLSPFQISLGLSLLVHGVVLGVVYTARHQAAMEGSATVSEEAGTLVIVSEPESSVVAEPQSNPVKSPDPNIAVPKPVTLEPETKPPLDTQQTTMSDRADDLAIMEELLYSPAQGENNDTKRAVPMPATSAARAVAVVCGVGCRNNPKPVYPREAQRRREEGLVILELTVTMAGNTDDVRLEQSSGHPLLDEAALEAVRQWRFTPARAGNVAIESQVEVPIRFKLSS